MRHDHPLVVLWFYDLNIVQGTPHIRCIMGSRDQWGFPPVFRSHWESLWTALTAGNLPAVKAVQRDCESVYFVIRFVIMFRRDTVMDSSNRWCFVGYWCIFLSLYLIIMRCYEDHGVSIHWQRDCLFVQYLIQASRTATIKTALLAHCDAKSTFHSENLTITSLYYYYEQFFHCFDYVLHIP